MKILFFIRSLMVGGSQRQLAMLARGLRQRGHEVAVAVFYTGGEIEVARDETALRVVPLGKAGRWDIIGPFRRLRRLLASERPDLIYAFQPTQTVLAALLLPRRLRSRLIFGLRAAGMEARHYDRLAALSYVLEALLSRRADLIIANALAGRADAIARGMPAERIAVIRNGIDTEAMRPDPAAGRKQRRAWGIAEDAFVVGCVARLDPMKDHPTLLTAAAAFAHRNDDARFVCVGDGADAYRNRLMTLAKSHGLKNRVLWAGEVAEVRPAYNAFDVATLPSAFGEGFPNVVGEAMACGIPVVATDVGDVRAIVGEHGIVVPPHRPDLLCAAWMRQREKIARGAISLAAIRSCIVSGYGVDAMVQRTEDAFARLLAGEPADAIAREFT
jgi:glycosyltransferase involved in cell wall biosynthesis